MSYAVLLRFNGQKDRPISLADSEEKLKQTTVAELKQKCVEEIPGEPDMTRLRLMFGHTELKEDKTLGFYNIGPNDVIVCIIRMPGGGAEETQGAGSTIRRSDSCEYLPPNM